MKVGMLFVSNICVYQDTTSDPSHRPLSLRSMKASPIIQAESELHISKHGQLKTGDAIVTSAGDLSGQSGHSRSWPKCPKQTITGSAV